jgi:phosphate transport system substrate-binding protein
MMMRNAAAVVTLGFTLVGAASTASWAQNAQTANVVTLHGVGSTFAAPLYKKWIGEYGVSHRNVSISYDAAGSGEGVNRFLAKTVDFAGSDEILSDSEIARMPGAEMVPVTAGMIALAYNIPGVSSEINLPRDVYVDIFAGKIHKWDDPRIQAANPGINFPHRDIVLVVRQDSSGTTAAFTNHLAAISPTWRAAGMAVGKLIEWPSGVLPAPGNEGVAARIRMSEGLIGYVEYWFAQRLGLRMAALQNKAGAYIRPTNHSGELRCQDVSLRSRSWPLQSLTRLAAQPTRSRPIAGCFSIPSTPTRQRVRPCGILLNGAFRSQGKTMALSLVICRSPTT